MKKKTQPVGTFGEDHGWVSPCERVPPPATAEAPNRAHHRAVAVGEEAQVVRTDSVAQNAAAQVRIVVIIVGGGQGSWRCSDPSHSTGMTPLCSRSLKEDNRSRCQPPITNQGLLFKEVILVRLCKPQMHTHIF